MQSSYDSLLGLTHYYHGPEIEIADSRAPFGSREDFLKLEKNALYFKKVLEKGFELLDKKP